VGESRLNILFLAIPLAILLGTVFAIGFFWAVDQGQFDDLETPAHRILFDDDNNDSSQEKI
jgi:cbb3-type cytochrome oxidase maturation protein